MATIFIQIACYRDNLLTSTIEDAVSKALHPERLSFGICLQSLPEDNIVLPDVPNIRVINVLANESNGACWARSQAQSLLQEEDYQLQIDSHMRFMHGWDELLIYMLNRCPSKKALLTGYVPGFEPDKELDINAPPYRLGTGVWTYHGVLLVKPHSMSKDLPIPELGFLLSGHFIFSCVQFIKECPYDPNLYFHGEEISLAVRAWTNGWDIYHPNLNTCYHKYSREGRVKVWDDTKSTWWQKDASSQLRVKGLLDGSFTDLGIYGLGNVRSLADYQNFSGINFKEKTISENAEKGIPSKNER